MIVMAVTSQLRPQNRFDIPLQDWRQAGLLKPSVVKPVIATIEKLLVIRSLGSLSDKDRETLAKQLVKFLG
ncbi:MAG: type II toxin-antitoxin system PemK/MazF family toxin [Immundisolibacter sp.]|uniref:type II toxin-antitoxin system PemK/MazF family toxin n=1 Tax=Immundisolibacter sp. TaxID=1934948 RepID=UPI003EDEF77D